MIPIDVPANYVAKGELDRIINLGKIYSSHSAIGIHPIAEAMLRVSYSSSPSQVRGSGRRRARGGGEGGAAKGWELGGSGRR